MAPVMYRCEFLHNHHENDSERRYQYKEHTLHIQQKPSYNDFKVSSVKIKVTIVPSIQSQSTSFLSHLIDIHELYNISKTGAEIPSRNGDI